MDVKCKDCDNDPTKPLNGLDSSDDILSRGREDEDDDDDESKSLLPGKGGLAKKVNKPRRQVKWNDMNGDKLAEVLVFQPSDVSDSDDEEDACMCRIM